MERCGRVKVFAALRGEGLCFADFFLTEEKRTLEAVYFNFLTEELRVGEPSSLSM